MMVIERIQTFFEIAGGMLSDPLSVAVLFGSVLLGILFGAMPGLTSTLGVALLTALTYSMETPMAMICLLSIYVGGTYGGSYASILINIPGTAAAAATALDGYPLACRGEGGRAIGLTTTASAIGTAISMLFIVSISPIISKFALEFTSFEFFLLAFFGILISGTLTAPDLVIKGWISGFLGLFLATIGRDQLQFYPRFTFGIPELDSGIEVVPVLIGAFGIPQIIDVLRGQTQMAKAKETSADNTGNRYCHPQHSRDTAICPHRCWYRRSSRHRRRYCRLGFIRYCKKHVQTSGNLRQR